MGKALGSWSGMRKYLEKEMLAESLAGRVRYNCTSYVGMDGCRVFELFIDGASVKRFSWETVNSYFIDKGCKDNCEPHGTREYWEGFWEALARYPINSRTEYTDGEFCDALEAYRNQSIDDSVRSDNPLERMFALLDRRLGMRRLATLKDDFAKQPEWLKRIYKIRCEVEQIG